MCVIARLVFWSALFLSIAISSTPVQGQLTIQGADGSDGAITVASGTTTINMDAAGVVEGPWETTSGTGSGVYDPDLKLFFLKPTTLTISPGATLRFAYIQRNVPVCILATGAVVIGGTLDLNGADGTGAIGAYALPGPGGFRGGAGTPGSNTPGLGPGGGSGGGLNASSSGYGNDFLVPLIGGSGGGGNGDRGGGAGGGAILVATPGPVQLNGSITARGGSGNGVAGNGSGGMVRLVADTITGSGSIAAYTIGPWLPGRIRFETHSAAASATVVANSFPTPIQVGAEVTPVIVPASTFASCRLVSIGGLAAPDGANFGGMTASATSLFLAANGPQEFVAITNNLDPASTTVRFRVAAQGSTNPLIIIATHVGPDGLGGEIWNAMIDVPAVAPMAVQVYTQ
jgi:hypothetical protein